MLRRGQGKHTVVHFRQAGRGTRTWSLLRMHALTYVFLALQLEQHGQDKVWEYARASNTPPPLVLRANPAKTSRDQLMRTFTEKHKWKVRPFAPCLCAPVANVCVRVQVAATERSPLGIVVTSRPDISPQLTDEYKVRVLYGLCACCGA